MLCNGDVAPGNGGVTIAAPSPSPGVERQGSCGPGYVFLGESGFFTSSEQDSPEKIGVPRKHWHFLHDGYGGLTWNVTFTGGTISTLSTHKYGVQSLEDLLLCQVPLGPQHR